MYVEFSTQTVRYNGIYVQMQKGNVLHNVSIYFIVSTGSLSLSPAAEPAFH